MVLGFASTCSTKATKSRPMNSSEATVAMMNQAAMGWGVKRSSVSIRSPVIPPDPLLPLRSLRERDGIQHRRALVAHDGEGAADRAGRLVLAVAARRVEIDAGAGHERDRPLHRANDLPERDLLGRAREAVAALGPARALHQAGL